MTDGQTDGIAISISRISTLQNKNMQNYHSNPYTKASPRKLSVDPQYMGLFITLNGKPVTFAGNKIPK